MGNTILILAIAGGAVLLFLAVRKPAPPQPNYTDAAVTLGKIFAAF